MTLHTFYSLQPKDPIKHALESNDNFFLQSLLNSSFELKKNHFDIFRRFLTSSPKQLDTKILEVIFTHSKIVALFGNHGRTSYGKVIKNSWSIPYLVRFGTSPRNDKMIELIVAFIKKFSDQICYPAYAPGAILGASAILYKCYNVPIEETKTLLVHRIKSIWTYVLLHRNSIKIFPDDYLPVDWLNQFSKEELDSQENYLRTTPLMLLSQVGDAASVQKLLSLGADPNARTTKNESALSFACQCGNLATVQALIEGGASIIDSDKSGNNLYLEIAKKKKSEALSNYLQKTITSYFTSD